MPGRGGVFMGAFVPNSRACTYVLILMMVAGPASTDTAKPPKHIVSTSLCADAYVLELADPENITSLSWQADSRLSAAPAALRSKNKGMASAERLVRLAPDLIVMGPGDAPGAANAAKKAGAKVYNLQWTESFDGIFANMKSLGKALHREARSKQQIRSIRMRLQALKTQNQTPPLRVLYLTPNGSSAGKGVFVNQAILAAGGINHGTTLGITGWGSVPLEKLALDPPDLIITSFFEEGYPSVANLRTRHPLLRQVLKKVPTATIAAKNWVCAGPGLIDAAEEIARAMKANAKTQAPS